MKTRFIFYGTIVLFGLLIILLHNRPNQVFITPEIDLHFGVILNFSNIIVSKRNWSQVNESIFSEFLRYKPLRFNNQFSKASPFLAQLECSRILENDQVYIKKVTESRLTYNDTLDVDIRTDCESIKTRNFFPPFPSSREEAEFPIAFARNVFKDYIFLEMELAAEYAPQNFYCYTLDNKAHDRFKHRMRKLASCFPNVIVSENEFDTTSSGNQINYALIECFKILSNYSWNYVITLNSYDVILRTNYELVQIFKWFDGANDIMIHFPNMDRVNLELNWTFAGLNLFRNASKNWLANGTSPNMAWAKSNFQSSISRAMVDFMLNELNLTKYMAQLEGHFAIDELFLSTLQATDELNSPGDFTHACLDRKIETYHVTRYNIWGDSNKYGSCLSNIWRHALCVFGMEDLHRFSRLPHLFANKMMPEHDIGAIVCWYEHLFNRSHLEPPNSKNLNQDYYLSMPHIRFHQEKKINGFVNISNFNCDFKYKDCMKEDKCL